MGTLWLVVVACTDLICSIVDWHTNLCWRFISWTVNMTTLPIRALGALHREKMLEGLVLEMQAEIQDLVLDNKRLQGHLQMSIKEHRLMESMLAELEEDLDEAIEKIELLETEVKQLNDDNRRLRECESKYFWDPKTKISPGEDEIPGTHDKCLPSETSWQSSGSKSTNLLDKWDWSGNPGPNPTGLVDPLTPLLFSSGVESDRALDQRRELALSQSLFSAVLSLSVGFIMWEAEQPCMPLVMALFTVVGLSLRSVVQLFSTIKNRPASNAFALLSFNWFILGALTFPTLPRVANMVSPVFIASLERMLKLMWVG